MYPLILPLLALISGVSIALNVWFFLRLRRKGKTKAPTPTIDAQDLLHDLTRRGSAIVKVEVVDASQLFLRSPRS